MALFTNKVVWITGAGTGIGRATARMFAEEGARLALFGRRAEKVQAVAAEAQALGAKAEAVAIDVADRARVDAAAARLLAQWGRVDVLVNNAGTNVTRRKLADLAPEDWDLVITVNLTGAFNMARAVLPAMRRQQDGLIVNVSSMAAKRISGVSGTAYASSKHGMNGLSLSIAHEESAHGIRATALMPGEVNTEILERRPVKLSDADKAAMVQPEDIAAAVRMLALLPPRTMVPEIAIIPTRRRALRPGE
ncbi:MAG: SDR family oxidoreductase [Candidatus Lambdaproteobacteria bacterium]|nr:SDR family oxidoreductase [Candidatus Lambdaproteobacteria bacterium]